MVMQVSTTPEGFKKLCEIVLKNGVPPLVDPKGEKEPFWTLVMPEGHVPDMVKITLMEWESTMGQRWPIRPKLRAGVGNASK